MKVVLTGGTGLVGTALSKKLLEKGYEVAILSRRADKQSDIPVFLWDYTANKLEKNALEGADYIIHLAGENIADAKWTESRKKRIIDSRVKSAEFIFNRLAAEHKKIKAFISSSAVGYYGAVTSDKLFTEEDKQHTDFLGTTCQLWEAAADKFQSIGIRTVKLRTGIVLTKEKGALEKMILPLKFGVGAALGSGRQYLPWIHIDDLCAMYIKAIEDTEMQGAYNSVAPEHITYESFIEEAAKVSKEPLLNIKVPSFLLKTVLGDMSDILLYGSRVSSDKIVKAGFEFTFPSVHSALKNLLEN